MSGESADKPEGLQTPASRRRRALRVPINDIVRFSVLDEAGGGDGAVDGASNGVELDASDGGAVA
ncbi:MAG: hypothetical protein WBM46_07660, partial [Polyangiales bacterium]